MARRRKKHPKARRSRKLTRKKRLWISRKIRKLMREGKKQKQAVAIAYRMAGIARKRKRRR